MNRLEQRGLLQLAKEMRGRAEKCREDGLHERAIAFDEAAEMVEDLLQ